MNKRKQIKTPHGVINTPVFLPDATRGFVKLLSNEELKSVGVETFVVNTFHLYLQPGMKLIKKAARLRRGFSGQGGIHEFINWQGPIVSDSGGFQVFSLIHKNPKMGKIFDDKVVFKSPLDGSLHELTPEKSIQIQFDLGTDIMICLDDCPPSQLSKRELEASVVRTISWAKRCKAEYERQIKKRKLSKAKRPLLFAVVQGGEELDLRKLCAVELVKIGFDGYGFGGGPVKFEKKSLDRLSKVIMDNTPKDAPKFGLGLGMPDNIVTSYNMGWDLFDCVIPTREGRHGKLFVSKNTSKVTLKNAKTFYKTINITNAKFINDFSPINKDSKLALLNNHSKAYLNHLFKMKDPLGHRLASLNNLEFYINLTKRL